MYDFQITRKQKTGKKKIALLIQQKAKSIVNQFYHHCDKIPEKTNLRVEEFILAHNVRGFYPSWEGHGRAEQVTS
jgi:hypothetical protein